MASDRQIELERFQERVRSCRLCVEAGCLPEAHPVIRGRAGNVRMLVGQAPGPNAHATGVPWSGASGRLLRTWFAQTGRDPEQFLDDWYLTSLTKCFPGKAASGAGDRAPSARERALCRPHLDGEVALVKPRVIVTVGRLAAEALIPAAKGIVLRDLVGTVHRADLGYGTIPIVPLPHPSGVGRWLNDPANRALVDIALQKLGEIDQ